MEDRFWGERIVLREVREALDVAGDEPIEVILAVRWGKTTEELVEVLAEREMVPWDVRRTDQYVLAQLDREQIDIIQCEMEGYVWKVFLNRPIEKTETQPAYPALDRAQFVPDEALEVVKAQAGLSLFSADGQGVRWAVLDTGIAADHPFFAGEHPMYQKIPARGRDRYRNPIQKQLGGFESISLNFTTEPHDDLDGHGTHVAGIIRQAAPRARLYDFKVLGEGGSSSFAIIEALYTIRRINTEARHLVVHGANLSLGGAVPVGSYGCGHSPECQEANRLAASGVVVVVSAGNDGHKTLVTLRKQAGELIYFPTFMGTGITDPGNAERPITVGSVHKTAPHTYGISHFSSKGPTGDGRFKPDVVAPGERIYSAYVWRGEDGERHFEYEPLSGTSMAAPLVSGAIAQFLSVHQEFLERPDEVKSLLMQTCTDLGRDRNFQGAGLIDVLRLLQAA